MRPDILPQEVARLGPLSVTDTALTSAVLSLVLVLAAIVVLATR